MKKQTTPLACYFMMAALTLGFAPGLHAEENGEQGTHYYERWSGSIFSNNEDEAAKFEGVSMLWDVEGGNRGGLGMALRFRLDGGVRGEGSASESRTEWDLTIGPNFHLADAAIFHVGPALNYVSDDDSELGAAIEAGWRGHFGHRFEARGVLRHDINDLIDDTSFEAFGRVWFNNRFGIHLGARHFFDAEHTRVYVGLGVNQE